MESVNSKEKQQKASDATLKKLSKKERRKQKIEERQCPDEGSTPLSLKSQAEPPVLKEKSSGPTIKLPAKNHPEAKERTEEIKVSADQKSKAQLRAERRELQEKQRLLKEHGKQKSEDKVEAKTITNEEKPKAAVKRTKLHQPRVQLLSHLERRPGYEPQASYPDVHPAFVRLGAQYASKTIIGSDARCLALLSALKHVIADFQTPHNQELCRAFEAHLNHNVEHLQQCRPMAVSMTNALRYFKVHLTHVPAMMSDGEKTKAMQKLVDNYVEDEIGKAAVAISNKVCEKIADNDVILTYGHSSLVNRILVDAKRAQRHFHVIVVDARPLLEGRKTLSKLVEEGIDCSYVLISAASFIMSRATKVIVGAHALLNNGYVMARTGTALLALIAKTHMKPVLVCSETSKFTERAQIDSFVYNEIGDPNEIMDCKDNKEEYLNALNLMYDVTPPKYVTGVATELGILPCTSVPVILRLKPTE